MIRAGESPHARPGENDWTLRVAVVDDDEETALILKDFLSRNGVDAECFSDAEGLFATEIGRFGAVILDIQLPGMWGSECGYELRRRGYAGPIVGMTGHLERWDPEDLRDLGFSMTLGKPLDPRRLLTCLKPMWLNDR